MNLPLSDLLLEFSNEFMETGHVDCAPYSSRYSAMGPDLDMYILTTMVGWKGGDVDERGREPSSDDTSSDNRRDETLGTE